MFDLDLDFDDAMELGAGYALFRHGQDRQTAALIDAIGRTRRDGDEEIHVHLHEEEEQVVPINAVDFTTADMPGDWSSFIGQEPLKRQLDVYMKSAQSRGERMPHTLLASGYPGVGKTTVARLIAQSMGSDIYEIVPPFKPEVLVEAARQLQDKDVLFIDECHKLADNGKRGAEFLLKMLEDGVVFLPSGEVVELADITVVGATTDRDKLPEPVIDRFPIKPYFGAYSDQDLARITAQFACRQDSWPHHVDKWMAAHIAMACRGTPRIIKEMVLACRALADAYGRPATPEELLAFLEVEPDGLTRTHIHYITSLLQYFARESPDGGVEYIIGEAAIMQILRETKQGIGRIERFLVERGLVDRTPRGRRLTALGIERATQFVAEGKGAADVA